MLSETQLLQVLRKGAVECYRGFSDALIRSRMAAFMASTSERRNPCTEIMPSPVVWIWMVE